MNFAILLAAGFLFLKTGEKFATQESAGPTVSLFTAKLGDYEPHVFNDPGKALEYCLTGKPVAGIVTPGFYFANAKALGLEPLLEIRRQKVAAERYVLLAKDPASRGKTIATPLAGELEYVQKVILRNQLRDVKLKLTLDVEGVVFDMVDGVTDAPTAVLMEEGTWQAIKADPELGGKVQELFTSEDLPGNLVVKFAGPLDVGKLNAALRALPAEIMESIRVEKFDDINHDRLRQAEELFHGK